MRQAVRKSAKYNSGVEASKAYPRYLKCMPAAIKISAVMAKQTIAVPRSGCLKINAMKNSEGSTAGISVCFQSSIDFVRVERNHARNKMFAGFVCFVGCFVFG